MQPDGVNLWYFKLKLFELTQFKVWNIFGLERYWDQKIGVCGINSIPFRFKEVGSFNSTFHLRLTRARCVGFLKFEFNHVLVYNSIIFKFYFFIKTHPPTKKSIEEKRRKNHVKDVKLGSKVTAWRLKYKTLNLRVTINCQMTLPPLRRMFTTVLHAVSRVLYLGWTFL